MLLDPRKEVLVRLEGPVPRKSAIVTVLVLVLFQVLGKNLCQGEADVETATNES